MNTNIASDTTTSALIEKLQSAGFTKCFTAGNTILEEQSLIRAVPIVLTGSIRVVRTDADTKEILLYYIQEGESCVMSFLSGLHHGTSKVKAIAEEDTTVLFIPIEKITWLLSEFPEWTNYIFRLYHKRFEELLEVVNAIAFNNLDDRLAQLIRKKCERTNNNTLVVTHEQLANELGTSRVVVSRLLKHMEHRGLVLLGRNKISLV